MKRPADPKPRRNGAHIPTFDRQGRCRFGESYQRFHKRVCRWRREHPTISTADEDCWPGLYPTSWESGVFCAACGGGGNARPHQRDADNQEWGQLCATCHGTGEPEHCAP